MAVNVLMFLVVGADIAFNDKTRYGFESVLTLAMILFLLLIINAVAKRISREVA
jgi:NhaP-type Na+/H+ or K+/H+ antiporter